MKPTEYIDADWLGEEIKKLAKALCMNAALKMNVEHRNMKETMVELMGSMVALGCLCEAIGRKLERPFTVPVEAPFLRGFEAVVLGKDWNGSGGIDND